MVHVMPVTEARKGLLALVDLIAEEYTRVDLTKRGRVRATLVSPEYLDSLEETIYTLENSMGEINRAQKAVARGEYLTLDEFKKALGKRIKAKR